MKHYKWLVGATLFVLVLPFVSVTWATNWDTTTEAWNPGYVSAGWELPVGVLLLLACFAFYGVMGKGAKVQAQRVRALPRRPKKKQASKKAA